MTEAPIHNIIQKSLKELEQDREDLMVINRHIGEVQAALDRFLENEAVGVTHSSLTAGADRIHVRVSNMPLSFHALSLGSVPPLLRSLALLGWKLDGEPSDWKELNCRTWTLKRREPAEDERWLRMSVRVFIPAPGEEEKGQTCQWVKVGTKTVDDYQLVCSDNEGEVAGG